jgi:type VI secretion system secreted protein VgrG
MGGVSPPRIGQEVIVDFLDGNPDRPIITGRVYNALQMPPFGNEVSGMRSKTLKGTGFNEVTMHDRPGRELLNMQAERDYTLLVKHDQISMVKNDKTTTVEQNHRLNVKANQSIAVEQNRQTMITGNDTEVVQGNRSEEVSGHHQESIHGTENVVVTLASSESIGLGKALNVGAGYAVNVGGAMNTLAGAASFEEVGLSKKTMVGKTYTIDVGDRVEIKTGYSSLVMESDGTIRLKGVNVEVEGTTGAWVRGETVGLEGPGDVEPSRLPPMGMFNEYFHIQDQAAGIELEKIPFRIKGEAGEIEGRTATGLTHHYSTGDTEKQIDLEYTGLEHESHGW